MHIPVELSLSLELRICPGKERARNHRGDAETDDMVGSGSDEDLVDMEWEYGDVCEAEDTSGYGRERFGSWYRKWVAHSFHSYFTAMTMECGPIEL